MKKRLLVFLLLLATFVAFSQQKKSVIKKDVRQTKTLNLIFPEEGWEFGTVPVTINFKWQQPTNVRNFTLHIECFRGGQWVSEIVKSQIMGDNIDIAYNKKESFRWKVTVEFQGYALFQSPWRNAKYTYTGDSAAPHQQGKVKPQFHPVPVSPKNNAVLTNFPRSMTFKWLHSTKPAYRHYQIQVDILHAKSHRWRSEMKERTFLQEDTTSNNFYHFNFTADRKGRWRVRGFTGSGNAQKYTPWSAWKFFEYRARR